MNSFVDGPPEMVIYGRKLFIWARRDGKKRIILTEIDMVKCFDLIFLLGVILQREVFFLTGTDGGNLRLEMDDLLTETDGKIKRGLDGKGWKYPLFF